MKGPNFRLAGPAMGESLVSGLVQVILDWLDGNGRRGSQQGLRSQP